MFPTNVQLRKKTSPLWKAFEDQGTGAAECSICGALITCMTSTGNLKRHLLRKHRGAYDTIFLKCRPKNNGSTIKAVKDLLELIEKHPCIWNTRCKSYGDAEKQNESWNQIASVLYPEENQSQVIVRLSRKFNALRLKFLVNRRRGVYYRELSFLDPLRRHEDKEKQQLINTIKEEVLDNSAMDENCLSETNEQNQTSQPASLNINQAGNNQPVGCSQSNFENILTKQDPHNIHLQIDSADKDSLFLLSLADHLKRVPAEFELSFKTDLLVEINRLLNKYS